MVISVVTSTFWDGISAQAADALLQLSPLHVRVASALVLLVIRNDPA